MPSCRYSTANKQVFLISGWLEGFLSYTCVVVPATWDPLFFSLLPEFAIKRMAEQLCCGRVIYKYSYCSKLKILYFPMMPLLSQTNFPDKHETAPVASPLDKRTPWKIMKSGGEGMRFSLGRCVCVWIAFNAAFRLRDFRWWLCCHGGCFSH